MKSLKIETLNKQSKKNSPYNIQTIEFGGFSVRSVILKQNLNAA
jgi:hypothetical protein